MGAPLGHALGHVVEDLRVVDEHEGQHTHPDYTAFLDSSKHRIDTDLECILCSQSSVFLTVIAVLSGVKEPGTVTVQQIVHQAAISLMQLQFVRGPPASSLS